MKKCNTSKILLVVVSVMSLSGCNKNLADIMVAVDGHHHVFELHEEETPRNCGETGIHKYYTCEECSSVFDENYNIVKISDLQYSIPHTFSHVNAVESTYEEEGVLEHYHCSVCNKNYADNEGKEVLKSVVMPKKSTYDFSLSKFYRMNEEKITITENATTLTLKDDECGANSFFYVPYAKDVQYFKASVDVDWEVAESFGICVVNNTRHVLCGLIPYQNVNFIRYAYGSNADFNKSFYSGSFAELNEKGAGFVTTGNRTKCHLTVIRDDRSMRLYCGNYMAWDLAYDRDTESIGQYDAVKVGIMYRPNRYSINYFKPIQLAGNDYMFEYAYNTDIFGGTEIVHYFNGTYNDDKTELTVTSVTDEGNTVTVGEDGMLYFDGKQRGFFPYEFNQDGTLKKDVGYTCSYSNFALENLVFTK